MSKEIIVIVDRISSKPFLCFSRKPDGQQVGRKCKKGWV